MRFFTFYDGFNRLELTSATGARARQEGRQIKKEKFSPSPWFSPSGRISRTSRARRTTARSVARESPGRWRGPCMNSQRQQFLSTFPLFNYTRFARPPAIRLTRRQSVTFPARPTLAVPLLRRLRVPSHVFTLRYVPSTELTTHLHPFSSSSLAPGLLGMTRATLHFVRLQWEVRVFPYIINTRYRAVVHSCDDGRRMFVWLYRHFVRLIYRMLFFKEFYSQKRENKELAWGIMIAAWYNIILQRESTESRNQTRFFFFRARRRIEPLRLSTWRLNGQEQTRANGKASNVRDFSFTKQR